MRIRESSEHGRIACAYEGLNRVKFQLQIRRSVFCAESPSSAFWSPSTSLLNSVFSVALCQDSASWRTPSARVIGAH